VGSIGSVGSHVCGEVWYMDELQGELNLQKLDSRSKRALRMLDARWVEDASK
jgi:hypothetical protein